MSAIVTEARRYVGTPFRHQGRLPGVGVDCVGLILGVGRALGLLDAPEQPYVIMGRPGQLRAWLDATLPRRLLRQPGDVLLLRIGRHESHVGIYCGHNPLSRTHSLIHAGLRGCAEHSLTPRWQQRIVAVYGWPHG